MLAALWTALHIYAHIFMSQVWLLKLGIGIPLTILRYFGSQGCVGWKFSSKVKGSKKMFGLWTSKVPDRKIKIVENNLILCLL